MAQFHLESTHEIVSLSLPYLMEPIPNSNPTRSSRPATATARPENPGNPLAQEKCHTKNAIQYEDASHRFVSAGDSYIDQTYVYV